MTVDEAEAAIDEIQKQEQERLVAEAIQGILAEIPRMKNEGFPPVTIQAEVEGKLIECGVDPETASTLAGSLLFDDTKADVDPEAARKEMVAGGILLLFGVGVAVGAYFLSGMSAYYVIASGPIVGGLALLVKGWRGRDQ